MSEPKYIDANRLIRRLENRTYRAKWKFIEMINEQPAVDVEPRWIPCSERMPKDRQRVLVQFINGFITLIDFHAEGLTNHIEAWMPLPTPYKGGEEK